MVTYDGSSRASGIVLYVDGVAVDVDVLRDHLYKDILYDPQAGDLQSKPTPLTLGGRFRDSGFKNGLVDDLRVFDVALTAVEVAGGAARPPADDGGAPISWRACTRRPAWPGPTCTDCGSRRTGWSRACRS